MRYQISSFEHLKQQLAALDDDPTKHWSEYPCLLWDRGISNHGYGKVRAWGKTQPTHRVSFILSNGKMPDEPMVCHHCDTPACFRPIHLFSGTGLDNVRDMISKGRKVVNAPHGEAHFRSKVTEAQVIEIRRLAEDGVSYAEIGRRYSMTYVNASAIVRRLHWRHI